MKIQSPRGLADRETARRVGDAAGALVLEDGGAHALGDGRRLVLAVLVDDDDLVAPWQQRAQRVMELMRLVERDDDAADASHAGSELDLADRPGRLAERVPSALVSMGARSGSCSRPSICSFMR